MMNTLLSDSDWESHSLSSDSDEQEDTELIYGGHAQSILSSLAESIGKIDDFLACGRGFMHGDFVCSISDPSGQIGRVVDVDMMVDLETVSGDIIKNINSKELLKLHSFAAGDYVVHGPWLGRVGRVYNLVIVLFDDGAKCEITADLENLLPVSPNVFEDTQCPHYPGQHVQVRFPSILKSARWLCGKWKAHRNEGIVCHVEVGSVHVNWVASVMVGCNSSLLPPAHLQDPKNLTPLSCFPHANWELGDWCMLPPDTHQHLFVGIKELAPNTSRKLHGKFGWLPRRDPAYKDVFVIVKINTKVDVMWQDGSQSSGLDSDSLIPVDNVGDHDFWPGQFVQEKGTYDSAQVSVGQRLGIVRSVDAKERTVNVQWMTPSLNQAAGSHGELDEETVSAYELVEHPDYSYCLGDVVFRLLPHSKNSEKCLPVIQVDGQNRCHKDRNITKMEPTSHQQMGKEVLGEKHMSEGPDAYSGNYLNCIGNVSGNRDGGIEVRWASGKISKVEPYDIVGIDRYEDPVSIPALDEQRIEDNACREMLSGYNESQEEKNEDELEKVVTNDVEDNKQNRWHASALLFPRAAFGFLTRIASSLFCSYASTSLSGFTELSSIDSSESYNPGLERTGPKDANNVGIPPWEKVSAWKTLEMEEPLSEEKDIQILRQMILKNEIQIQNSKEVSLHEGNERSLQFKKFDTVDDYSDHHFINGNGSRSMLPQVKRTWLKKVRQDWALLEKDLPDNIYVRVYEERIDLMRAALIGAPGTPYHGALFFFDIILPPDYPHEPPLVHYISGGLRLNPNLYESGRICLSLLNTWTGMGSEVWNPQSSTILQVLLSLQALVLNEKPYFNEAGYEKLIGSAEGEKNSITYNENAFLLSLKSMIYLLCKPPKNFEALIEEHFRLRSHSILLTCKAYMDDAKVSWASSPGEVTGETHKSCSMGFKIMLSKLFPKLISTFTQKGIDCHLFLGLENEVLNPGLTKNLEAEVRAKV